MANKKAVIFLGGPRPQGYSTLLAREAGRGAAEAGFSVKEYDLNDKGVRGCQSCFHCRETYGCSVQDSLAPAVFQDIAEAGAVIIASPIYFYQVTGQTKLWVDRMFPLIDGAFKPRQPGKKAITVFAQNQANPELFKSGMDWLNNILKNSFGWNLAASLVCCGSPEKNSPEFAALLKQARDAGKGLS